MDVMSTGNHLGFDDHDLDDDDLDDGKSDGEDNPPGTSSSGGQICNGRHRQCACWGNIIIVRIIVIIVMTIIIIMDMIRIVMITKMTKFFTCLRWWHHMYGSGGARCQGTFQVHAIVW